MQAIVANAKALKDRYASREAVKQQLRLQLQLYSSLLAPDVALDESDVDTDWCQYVNQGIG